MKFRLNNKISSFFLVVDPLLRERIWNHLVELARAKNTTILLSTHYIEEAKQSDCIGLMRNGALIAEDSPQNILDKLETNNLEEAFLKLSLKQESSRSFGEVNVDKSMPEMPQSSSQVSSATIAAEAFREKPQRKPKIMKALLIKNFFELIRNFMYVLNLNISHL